MRKKGHKRVVINLFAGKEWRHRRRERASGHIKGSWQWDELREWRGQIRTTMWTTGMRGKLLGDTGNQLCDDLEGWGRGWEGGSWGRGYMYTYSGFIQENLTHHLLFFYLKIIVKKSMNLKTRKKIWRSTYSH